MSFIGETIRMICDKTIDTLIEKCVILINNQEKQDIEANNLESNKIKVNLRIIRQLFKIIPRLVLSHN